MAGRDEIVIDRSIAIPVALTKNCYPLKDDRYLPKGDNIYPMNPRISNRYVIAVPCPNFSTFKSSCVSSPSEAAPLMA